MSQSTNENDPTFEEFEGQHFATWTEVERKWKEALAKGSYSRYSTLHPGRSPDSVAIAIWNVSSL